MSEVQGRKYDEKEKESIEFSFCSCTAFPPGLRSSKFSFSVSNPTKDSSIGSAPPLRDIPAVAIYLSKNSCCDLFFFGFSERACQQFYHSESWRFRCCCPAIEPAQKLPAVQLNCNFDTPGPSLPLSLLRYAKPPNTEYQLMPKNQVTVQPSPASFSFFFLLALS